MTETRRLLKLVAQTCSLPYRRVALGRALVGSGRYGHAGAAQIANLRHSRVQLCVTAKSRRANGVAQTCSLPYRRVALGSAPARPKALVQPILTRRRPALRRLRIATLSAACCLALLLTGCASGPPKLGTATPIIGSDNDSIEEVNLLAIPVAMNLDATPGPDGVVLKVFAGNRRAPQPIPIRSGAVEVLMFDGLLDPASPAPPVPRKTWRYSVEELRRFEVHTSIGTGYQIAANWGQDAPAGDRVSVLVRYVPTEGRAVLSAPSVISVTGQ